MPQQNVDVLKAMDYRAIRAVAYLALHTAMCLLIAWMLNVFEPNDTARRWLYCLAAVGVLPMALTLVPSSITRAFAAIVCLGLVVVWVPIWLYGLIFCLIMGVLPGGQIVGLLLALVITLPLLTVSIAMYNLGAVVMEARKGRTADDQSVWDLEYQRSLTPPSDEWNDES